MRKNRTLKTARRVWSRSTLSMVLVREREGADCGGLEDEDFSETFWGGGCFLEGRRYSRRDCLVRRLLACTVFLGIDKLRGGVKLTNRNLAGRLAHRTG